MTTIGLANLLQFRDGQWQDAPAPVVWLQTASDWDHVARWQRAARGLQHEAVRDSLEYATLATKRWRFLKDSGTAPDSLPEFLRLSREEVDAETGFTIALIQPGTDAGIAGFAFARRSWANNLILEFLAAAPHLAGEIRGTGGALMASLAAIALSLESDEIWGECTKLSRGFYAHLKSRIVTPSGKLAPPEAAIRDRFQFASAELRVLLEMSRVSIEGCTKTNASP